MSKANETLWGISWTQDGTQDDLPLVEIPHKTLSRRWRGEACTLQGTFWYLSAEDLPEQLEREALLVEEQERLGACACVINLPPAWIAKAEAEEKVRAFLRRRSGSRSIPIYFDFGKLGPPPWMDRTYCVSDPLWFEGEVWGDYWKIHGWHPDRWVRLYSRESLLNLKSWAARHEPRFVVLAHSQREAQLRELLGTE